MLTFNEVALNEAAEELLKGIQEFLAVPRTKQQVPKDWSQRKREDWTKHWEHQKTLPRKQQEPRQIALKGAELAQPMCSERAQKTIEKVITGVYQKTQVQQLCFDLGRSAYSNYSGNQSEFTVMAIGAYLLRVLDEHCTAGEWSRSKEKSMAERDIAGYTKTWVTAPEDYVRRITGDNTTELKDFYDPEEVEPWTINNIRSNQFIRPKTPECDWVLNNMTGGRSFALALTAVNANQAAQYRFDHKYYANWFHSTWYEEEHSPFELRNRMTNRERVWALNRPVSFRYIADSRLRLYASDTMSPQAGKTRSYFWKPCDKEGVEIETQMLDNTGSGFQLMSCISLDERAAKYSNLLPNEGKPYDIYTEISREALRYIPKSHPVAQLSLEERQDKTLKKISKTASMATLYGGGITHYSKELVAHLDEELPPLTVAEKREIETAFETALKNLFPELRAAYQWMFEALTVAVEHCDKLTITLGYDHQFRTKKRMEVYKKVSSKCMGGFVGEVGGTVRYKGKELDTKGTARSYLAGIIQGLDACLLGMTVSNYIGLGTHHDYNTYIATTHDSYRIVAGDHFWLGESNRQSLRILISEINIMQRLYHELSEQVPTGLLTKPPPQGSLDIDHVSSANHILTSEPMEPPTHTSSEVDAFIGF